MPRGFVQHKTGLGKFLNGQNVAAVLVAELNPTLKTKKY